ncbi:hypothetical protein PGB90_000034 [Kerria lacca]
MYPAAHVVRLFVCPYGFERLSVRAIFHVEFGGDALQALYSEGGSDVRCP